MGKTASRTSKTEAFEAPVNPFFAVQPEATTRERLIQAARLLFLMNGYADTGMSAILRTAKVNSGSFYYFFQSKHDLLLAVLDSYGPLLRPGVLDPAFATTADPLQRVFAILAGYREMLLATEFRQGCPIGNLALEMGEKSDEVRKKIAENFEGWRGAVRRCLDEAAALPAEVGRDELATFILAVMEGGVMLARTHRSVAPFDAAVAGLRRHMEMLCGRGP